MHGGALATLIDETCGRAAFARLGLGEGQRGKPVVTAWLKLDYVAMSQDNQFYVIEARVKPDDELPAEERGKGSYKAYVDAVLSDADKRKPRVLAQALYVGPKPKPGEKVEAQGPKLVPLDRRF